MIFRRIGPLPPSCSAHAGAPLGCPSCAETISPEALHCTHCRTWLVDTVRCGLCSEIVATSLGYCYSCGSNLVACNLQRYDPAALPTRRPRSAATDGWFAVLLVLVLLAVLGILLGLQTLFPLHLHLPGSTAQTSGTLVGSLLVVLAIGAGIWLIRGSDSLSDLVDAYGQGRTADSQTRARDIGHPVCGIWPKRRER